MGSAFRRSYKDKRTGKAKKVKCYSIKYLDAAGQWVTETTDTTSRTVALRLLAEREVAITGRTSVPELPESEEHDDRPLSEIQELYLAWLVLRRKPSTCRLYTERLDFTLRNLAVDRLGQLDSTRIDDYIRTRRVVCHS